MINTVKTRIVDSLMLYETIMPVDKIYSFHIGKAVIELTVMLINNSRVIIISVGEFLDMGACMAHIYPSELLNDNCALNVTDDSLSPYVEKTYAQHIRSYEMMIDSLENVGKIPDVAVDYEPEVRISDLGDGILDTNNISILYNKIFRNSSCDTFVLHGTSAFHAVFNELAYDYIDDIINNNISYLLRIEIDSKVDLSVGNSHYWQHVDIEPVIVFGELHIAIKLQKYGIENKIISMYTTCAIDDGGDHLYSVLEKISDESTRVFSLVSSKQTVHSIKIYNRNEEK